MNKEKQLSRWWHFFGMVLVTLLGLIMVAGGASALARVSASGPGEAPASSQASQKAQGTDAPDLPVAPQCGPNWAVVSSPSVGTYGSFLTSVAAISSSDVWAVGYYNVDVVTSWTLVEHWNGTAWSIVASPNAGTNHSELYGVAAISAGDVWAVGYYLGSSGYQTLVEHWNGSAWVIVNSPNANTSGNYLRAVAAISSDDVWAAGYYVATTTGIHQTLTEHWNGSAWSVVASPNVGGYDNEFRGVAAISAGDVWAVGYYNTELTARTLVEHWNGSGWSRVDSPNAGTSGDFLNGIAAVSAGDIWAVGYYYPGGSAFQTLVEHWNGSTWSVVNSPNVGTSYNDLYGVAAASAGDVWAVGYYYAGASGPARTLVEHWNGSAWSVVNSPNVGASYNDLHGVAARSAADVWAVGYYDSGTIPRTLVERYNPCATPTPTACPIQYTDVPPGSTFYPYVRCLACRGIVNGYPDGTFKPNNPVTRGQLSKIVSNSAGYSEIHLERTFQDVPTNSTFYQFIERLATRGFINGYPCGGANEPCVPPTNLPYFRPGANVTRGQTSKIVASAKGLPSPPSGQRTFQDVPVGSTFWQWIEALASTSAISGYPCGNPEPCVPPGNLPYFRPNANVTRGQSTKIVGNTFFPGCQTPQGSR